VNSLKIDNEFVFQQLVSSVKEYAIFVVDLSGNIASWNDGAQLIKGYQASDIIGKHFSIFYPDEDIKSGRPEEILKIVLLKSKFEEEGWRVRKDGTKFWASILINEIKDKHGNTTGFAKITRDLTERKNVEKERIEMVADQQASAAIRRSELKLRAIFELSPIGISLVAIDGTFIDVNQTLCDILGYTQEELYRLKFQELTLPEDRELSKKGGEDLVSGRVKNIHLEKRYLHKTGKIVWAYVSATMLRDETGSPQYFISQTSDITEKKLVQNKIKEQKLFLRAVLDALPVALICKDAQNDFRISLWNKCASDMWGISAEDAIGKNDNDFFPKDQADFFLKKDLETLQSKSILDIPEVPIQTKNNGIRYLHTKKVPIFDTHGNGQFILGISEDITDKKNSETIIEAQRLNLINAGNMTALGEMAGGIAHEINTPLAIITSAADQVSVLLNESPLQIEKIKRKVGQINSTAQRVAQIVRGLRIFSRDSTSDPWVNTSLKQAIADTVSLCAKKFQNSEIQIDINIVEDSLIFCVPTQISQVILNLMNNSFDAIEKLADKWVRFDFIKNDSTVKLIFTDSGSGLDLNVQQKLMQPFFTTKEVGKGTGLGLSISKGIIENFKGKLYYEPKCKNTCFVIELPLSKNIERKTA
jgi:PAS domain S-box-containing protein